MTKTTAVKMYLMLSLLVLHNFCGGEETSSLDISSDSSSTQLQIKNLDKLKHLPVTDSFKLFSNNNIADFTQSESDGDNNNIKVERSASPFSSEKSPMQHFNGKNNEMFNIDTNDVEDYGNNFNLIQPTSTTNDQNEKTERKAKDLLFDPLLVKGSSRPDALMTPINPTSVSSIPQTPSLTNRPRQNPNPDIQDIITGIVKLLNGNVNVHANTQQSSRRPYTTRINNRGPPRISEAQPLPNDFDQQIPISTLRPPPYPFDRPDGPIRPFNNGVPLPEQIVPSMQQNYRPGFISQNRPPWQRPRPRPPITGNRRPIPPYQPIQTMPEYQPQDEIQLTTVEIDTNSNFDLNPTDTTTGDITYEVEEEPIETVTSVTAPIDFHGQYTYNRNDHEGNKENNQLNEKNITVILYPTSTQITPSMTTIIQSTSEINIAQYTRIPVQPTKSSIDILTIESSIEDVTTHSTYTSSTTPILLTTEKVIKVKSTSKKSIPVTTGTFASDIQTALDNSNLTYHPRPGVVLDDPEFKPGGYRQRQKPTIQPTPLGYGEIFDVTLTAIQGPSGGESHKTVKINPYTGFKGTNNDIIVAPSGDDGFVSIDGKRTYIDLFGESTNAIANNILPETTSIKPTQLVPSGITGTGYAVVETQTLAKPTVTHRPHYRPRIPQQPPVRIDTCIVGDDTTCDLTQNEKCKTEIGVSSCHCRPGFARRKHREQCRKIVSILMSLRVDKIYERKIVWDKLLSNKNTEPYAQLSYEAVKAIDSAMSMTPFSDEFLDARVNNIYNGDASQGSAGIFVNLTLQLEENGETLQPNIKSDIQKHLLGVIHRRNNNIGNSVLYVESPAGSISNLQDLDECTSSDLNDCHPESTCINIWGSFRCECKKGLRDPWFDQPQRAGRECHTCPEEYCNNRGTCIYENGYQVCTCSGSYYGNQCEIDGEVLGVAIGASVSAVIIIVLTLVCLVMWSRRWQKEQKNAMGSPVFGYMTAAQVKTPGVGQTPYQVTLEDRMRWAQIADVMAQSNHYGAEPVNTTRPSTAMFGYPNLQLISNMGTMRTMSMAGTLPHTGTLAPIPLPRYGLKQHTRSNGMRTLDNSSSSEEEDRTDLLGRSFQVPRPKSRSSGSIANQSGIYYDVDYEPSGGNMYDVTQPPTISNPIMGPQGIPMSTYTAGRAPSLYYMK